MVEYEYIFSTTVQQKLKRIIRGKIYVAVNRDDELCINITSVDGIEFRLSLSRFSDRLCKTGMNSDLVVRWAVREYKEYIHNQIDQTYFYQD